jgi:hypothetical protein
VVVIATSARPRTIDKASCSAVDQAITPLAGEYHLIMKILTVAEAQTTKNLWPNAIRRLTSETTYAIVVSPDGTLERITYGDLENFTNRAAWFLETHCPETSFYYMGPNDIRMKTGKCVSRRLGPTRCC